MRKKQKNKLCSLAFFGSPPLIPGEDEAAYNELLDIVVATLKPSNVLEMIWVRDVVDLEWELRRLRRIKANLLDPATSPASLTFGRTPIDDRDLVVAIAASENISPLERLDRMISLIELRRNRALAELERHQEAKKLIGQIADEVVDADFLEVRERDDDDKASE